MKKIILYITLSLTPPLMAVAQEPAVYDSVLFMGTVVGTATGRPEPRCEVQLLSNGEAVTTLFTDDEGLFGATLVPVGAYTLSVFSNGSALYRADISLYDNVSLRIELMLDTVHLRALPPVEVSANRHLLGQRLIRSANDPRLWDMFGHGLGGPASADLSWSTPNGKNPYWSSGLRSWRPAWLDAPWPVQRKKGKSEEPEKEK